MPRGRLLRNLTPGEVETYEGSLFTPHERRVEMEMFTLGGSRTGELGLQSLSGQVACSRGGPDAVGRMLTLRAVDRDRTLDFAKFSPGEGLFFNRMIRAWDSRYIPDLGTWVSHPMFTGPIWAFKRKGSEVELTAHGKERLAMGTLWVQHNIRKGRSKAGAIRELLELVGEESFDLNGVEGKRGKVPEKRSLDRYASPWAHSWKLAASMNRQLLYDGYGVCRLRRLPGKSAFVFRTGTGGSVMGDPEVSRSLDNHLTHVIVLGKKPKGGNRRPRAVVHIKGGHELSAADLGRNGTLRIMGDKIEDSSLRSDKDCEEYGEEVIAERTRGLVDASFEAAPSCHHDVGDLARLELPEGSATFRLWDFTLPLGEGETMQVGSVEKRGGRSVRLKSKTPPGSGRVKRERGNRG